MADRQKKLLEDMMKFAKCSDGLAAVGFASATGGKASNSSNNSVKEKSVSSTAQTPKKAHVNPGDTHFSGSAFLSSPDPSALPYPDFGDNPVAPITGSSNGTSGKKKNSTKGNGIDKRESSNNNNNKEESAVDNKTNILKKFLKVRRS